MTVLDDLAVRSLALETPPTRADGDGRTVSVRLVSYGVTARVSDDNGRTFYDEQFAPGSVRAIPNAAVYVTRPRVANQHADGPILVGRIVAYRSAADGCYADVRIADTAAGRDLLAELDEQIIRHVSIEFDAPTLPAGRPTAGVVVHTDAVVSGLLFTNNPQSPGADVLGRRSRQGDTAMTMTDTPPQPVTPDPPQPAPAPAPAPAPDPVVPVDTAPANRSTPTVAAVADRTGTAAPSAATRFRSFGEFVHACAFGSQRVTHEERARVFRALDRAVLADVPGLLQTSWTTTILDLIRPYLPVTQSFTETPLPDKGMVIGYPKVTVKPLVGVQPSDGGNLPSRAVEVSSGSMAVGVYGGGQEMTIGTIQRTDPPYLDLVMRLYVIEMAKNLEAAVTTAVWAAADDVNTAHIEMGNTDALINKAFVDASVPFLTNLNRLPEFAIINTVLWQKMANAVDSTGRPLFPSVSPFNPVGSVGLQSPDGQIRDLPFRVAPGLGGATSRAVVGVREAFMVQTGPIQTLQADVPETLVHQMAVFQFAAFGAIDAGGLVIIEDLV